MRIETTRIIADWLLHPTKGVNSYIPSVPRDAGDPVPPLIATWDDPEDSSQVSNLAVFDDTRHRWVMRLQDPPAMPCLWVSTIGNIDLTGQAWPQGNFRTTSGSPVLMAIGYVTTDEDIFTAVRDGEYTLRAVARSLNELMKNENADACFRNNVRVISILNPLRYSPMSEAVGASRMSGGILINLHIEDGNAAF